MLLSPSTLFALPENGIGRSETVTTILQQQKQTITGTILTGDTNEPAIGATVYLRNSTTGTVTDVNGKYSITVEGIGGVLEFSYIGYKKQEVAVTGQKTIDIVLQPDTEVLEEVVVVGYGSQKKERKRSRRHLDIGRYQTNRSWFVHFKCISRSAIRYCCHEPFW